MATNSKLPTTESKKKKKQTKQPKQRENHGYGEHFDGYQMGRGCKGMSEEVRGLRSTDR